MSLLAYNGVRIDEAPRADVVDYTYQRGHRVLRVMRKGDRTSAEPLVSPTVRALDAYLDDDPWLALSSSTAPRPDVLPTRPPSGRCALSKDHITPTEEHLPGEQAAGCIRLSSRWRNRRGSAALARRFRRHLPSRHRDIGRPVPQSVLRDRLFTARRAASS